VAKAEPVKHKGGGEVDEPFKTLIEAAIQAPSGDNTQPWRFVIDSDARQIELHLDETRDPSPMNSGQRMARMGIGAALENMVRTADSLNWTIKLERPSSSALCLVRILGCDAPSSGVDPIIKARVTNRRLYDGRPVPAEVIDELRRRTPDLDGIKTLWITERDRVNALASLIGRSDAQMLCEPSMRRAFLDNIRFDVSWDAKVEEGLSLASLELPAADRFALRLMPRLPNWLLVLGGVGRKFAATGRRLVTSSSGVCLVIEREGTPESEVLVGRAMERAWLALTKHGLAVQPMMSMAILDSLLSRGSDDLRASLGCARATALVEEFRLVAPEIDDAHTAFIMRYGYAAPPTARTGRLPIAASIRDSGTGQRSTIR
jgi:hypothetical protein